MKLMSHLTRGAWIEILFSCKKACSCASHLTRGAWIEICIMCLSPIKSSRRTSHEVRGLKFTLPLTLGSSPSQSHLTRGAWIEIFPLALPEPFFE